MKRRNIFTVILLTVFVLTLSFLIVYGNIKSEETYRLYYKTDINGIVKSVRRAKGGELLIHLSSFEKEFRSGIYYDDIASIRTGDSISKPAYWDYLLLYRKNKDSFEYKFYHVDAFDKYSWKKPSSFESTPDWKELIKK